MKNWIKVLLLFTVCFTCIAYVWEVRTTDYAALADARQQIVILQDRAKTLDLALEFGFDPMIVQVVRQLSAKVMHDRTETAWRFIRTEDDLAYVMLSIVSAESAGNPRAVGDGNRAFGLGQIWLSTAQMYDPKITGSKLLTVEGNLTVGMNHFVDLLNSYNGNYALAVLAWNRGMGAVNRSLALGISPENGYSQKVFLQAASRNAIR